MLVKNQRITKELVQKTIREGGSFQTDHLNLRVLFEPKLIQVGFVVSKKVSKKATDRNLLKRRGRYIIRKHSRDITPRGLYVFIFKQNSNKISFENLEKEFCLLFQKAKILNK